MSLAKIRREAETISRYADRIERADPTEHVGAIGYAARHILVMLDRLEDAPPDDRHQSVPGRMSFTVLERGRE